MDNMDIDKETLKEYYTFRCIRKNRIKITTEEKEQLVSIVKQPGIPDTYFYTDKSNNIIILKKAVWYKICCV